MKQTITIFFLALTIFCSAQDDKLLSSTSATDTTTLSSVSTTDKNVLTTTSTDSKPLTNSSTDNKIAPSTAKKNEGGYILQKPTKDKPTSSTDNKYYTGTNMDDVYSAEWKRQNPSYNQMVATYYQNNSTSPFESELRQVTSTAKVALTAEMMQFFSALPNVKIY